MEENDEAFGAAPAAALVEDDVFGDGFSGVVDEPEDASTMEVASDFTNGDDDVTSFDLEGVLAGDACGDFDEDEQVEEIEFFREFALAGLDDEDDAEDDLMGVFLFLLGDGEGSVADEEDF